MYSDLTNLAAGQRPCQVTLRMSANCQTLPPLIGALLREPWQTVRDHMLDGLHAHGFADLTSAHLNVLQHPGPDAVRPTELAARTRMTRQALNYLLGDGSNDGREGALTPEFILLDVKLPKLDGLQVLERLRDDERTQYLPVILFSSSREHEDVVEGYKLGANSYVAKPANFERFSEAMRYLG